MSELDPLARVIRSLIQEYEDLAEQSWLYTGLDGPPMHLQRLLGNIIAFQATLEPVHLVSFLFLGPE
jgi:hypothetical protein